MHIIKDENGNVCPHGHEHGHAHTHTHDGVCQEGCSGCEPHDPKKENIALLTYMPVSYTHLLCVPVAINKWKIRSAYKEGGSDNA